MADNICIDASHWNTVSSWTSVKQAGVAGVIHKVSQGTSYRDPTYAGRCGPAKAAGLLWGRYHFGDGSDVSRQVDNFLDGWQPGELLALDYEDNASSQMTLSQACDFVERVYGRTGVLPALYSGNTLKDAIAKGGKPGILTQCRLWLAQYGPNAVLPPGWDSWWLWQYTDRGTVAGIQGNVDCNRYSGAGVDQLAAEWAGEVPEPPVYPDVATTVTITVPAGVPVRLVVSGNVEIEQA